MKSIRHPILQVQRCILLTLTATAWTVAPAQAQAQWVVTPYLGINLAGDAEFRRGGPGVSVAIFGERLGFEFDVERHNHFFKDKDVAHLVSNNCGVGPTGEPCTDLNTDAIGFMGNVMAPIRIAGAKNWRPYATAGLGVIRSWVTDPSNTVADTNQNNFALNVGCGVMYSLNNRVALRGDVRYFLAFVNEDTRDGFYFNDYGFLRATFGVTFGFPR
jgi:opacity protein-like surface antigen